MLTVVYLLGLTSANRWPYLLWSGIVGDLSIFGAVVIFYHKHSCHEPKCWRPGKYRHTDRNGHESIYCKHHTQHPRFAVASVQANERAAGKTNAPKSRTKQTNFGFGSTNTRIGPPNR